MSKRTEKKQNLLKRLILGDDGENMFSSSSGTSTPNRPPPRAPAPPVSNDDETMLYLAREISKQAYKEENKQRDSSNSRERAYSDTNEIHSGKQTPHTIKHSQESQESLQIALEASKETAKLEQAKHQKDQALEDAIVQSLIEATRHEDSNKVTQRKQVHNNPPHYPAMGYDQPYPMHPPNNNYPTASYDYNDHYYNSQPPHKDMHQYPHPPPYQYHNYAGNNHQMPVSNNYQYNGHMMHPNNTHSPPTINYNHTNHPMSYSPSTFDHTHNHHDKHEVLIDDEFLDPKIIAAIEKKNKEIEEKKLHEMQHHQMQMYEQHQPVYYSEPEPTRARTRTNSAAHAIEDARSRTSSQNYTANMNIHQKALIADDALSTDSSEEQLASNLDPANILHPNNATALKAATALIQLARKHVKNSLAGSEKSSNALARETAALQLASLWVNQTALYLNQQDPTLVTNITSGGKNQTSKPLTQQRSFRQEQVVDNVAHGFEERIHVSSPSQQEYEHNKIHRKPSYHLPNTPAVTNAHSSTWQCEVCTLINNASNNTCEACGLVRSK